MLGIGDWINRKRHNRGFGIQSPSAFFFITQVLNERLPYYAYDALDEIADACKEMACRRCRTLFRIANYLNPASSIIVESTTAACAISHARRFTPKMLITSSCDTPETVRESLTACACRHKSGNTLNILREWMEANSPIGLLYIGKCDNQPQLLESAMRHTNKESVIIVEGIHRDKEHRDWWRSVTADPRNIVTYDMYSMGILFFDTARYKQNYTLKK